MHSPIRAVIFDFDSTLAETHIDFGDMRRRIVQHLKDWRLWNDVETDTRWVLELIAHGAEKLAARPDDRQRFLEEAEQHLQDVEVEGCAEAKLYPGTLEALADLCAHGVAIGIVTRNCRRCVTPVLEHHAVAYDVLLTRDDVSRVKPDPLHLHAALELLDVPSGQALMVGDHPTDIECGIAAGAMTAGVLTGKTTREEFSATGTDIVCDDVAEVVRWVLARNRDAASSRDAAVAAPPLHAMERGPGGEVVVPPSPEGEEGRGVRTLPLGKLDLPLLQRLLGDITPTDPSVLVGPGVGCDVAVLDIASDHDLLVKTDPITFATDAIGHYAVAVNANDIATTGGVPKWFLATVLLPEKVTTEVLVESLFEQLREACAQSGISLVGGHTEVTFGLDRPIIVGQMLGLVPHGKAITSAGARPGDAILLTKDVAVEGTAIIARERHDDLLAAGFDEAWLAQAQGLLFTPGISVLPEAQAAVAAAELHAMHDPTEGGVATGLWELAVASGVGIAVDVAAVPILPQCARLCRHLGIDPLGLIASGSLLIAVAEAEAAAVIAACEGIGVPCARIGEVFVSDPQVTDAASGALLPRFDQDEITRVL